MLKNKQNNKKKRLLFVASIFAISVLALFFIITNFRDNIVFFYSPSELGDQKILQKIQNIQFRIGGLVKKDSINKINSLETEFVIYDNEKQILVNYRGILPNLFREEQGVVANGNLDVVKSKFYSKELLVKHDENYVPPEIKSIQIK